MLEIADPTSETSCITPGGIEYRCENTEDDELVLRVELASGYHKNALCQELQRILVRFAVSPVINLYLSSNNPNDPSLRAAEEYWRIISGYLNYCPEEFAATLVAVLHGASSHHRFINQIVIPRARIDANYRERSAMQVAVACTPVGIALSHIGNYSIEIADFDISEHELLEVDAHFRLNNQFSSPGALRP